MGAEFPSALVMSSYAVIFVRSERSPAAPCPRPRGRAPSGCPTTGARAGISLGVHEREAEAAV